MKQFLSLASIICSTLSTLCAEPPLQKTYADSQDCIFAAAKLREHYDSGMDVIALHRKANDLGILWQREKKTNHCFFQINLIGAYWEQQKPIEELRNRYAQVQETNKTLSRDEFLQTYLKSKLKQMDPKSKNDFKNEESLANSMLLPLNMCINEKFFSTLEERKDCLQWRSVINRFKELQTAPERFKEILK